MTVTFTTLLHSAAPAVVNRRFKNDLMNDRLKLEKAADGSIKVVKTPGLLRRMTSPARTLGNTIKKLNGTYDIDREAHLMRRRHFQSEVQDAIRNHYGTELGNRFIKKVGLDRDGHSPRLAQITNINALAKAELKEASFDLLKYLHDGTDLMTFVPDMAYLSESGRETLRVAIVERVTSTPAFEAGEFTSAAVMQEARAILSAEMAPDVEQGKRAALQAASSYLEDHLDELGDFSTDVERDHARRAIADAHDHLAVHQNKMTRGHARLDLAHETIKLLAARRGT